jgi:hypothetical protein
MNNDDIIRLAIEHTINGLKFNEDGLLRFAKLVAQHERDACADLCKEMYLSGDMDTGLAEEAILARGDGITLTTIRHPRGKPALGDLNPESLETIEIDLPEPVAIYRAGQTKGEVYHVQFLKEMEADEVLLYATPVQRTWVGLMEEEVFAVSNTMPYGDRFDFAEAIEAKLKEKNT